MEQTYKFIFEFKSIMHTFCTYRYTCKIPGDFLNNSITENSFNATCNETKVLEYRDPLPSCISPIICEDPPPAPELGSFIIYEEYNASAVYGNGSEIRLVAKLSLVSAQHHHICQQ